MRKNGVIRGIQPICGGVCAPVGFTACGSEKDFDGWEYALIKSEDRLSSAFSCSESGFQSSALQFAQKRFNGILRAYAVLSGVPDVGEPTGLTLAKELCVHTGRALGVPDCDVLPLIVGDMSKRLKTPNVKEILRGANTLKDNSASAARSICGLGVNKEIAYSFYIGDVCCKIGFVGRGATFGSPDCLLALMTTDVNMSAPLLQKALDAEMKDSFGMLCLSDLPSPCDAVAVMASGKAGNYPITQADTDYHKFTAAFHLSCWEICKILACKTGNEQVFICSVKGAKSKQSAREIAKTVAKSSAMKGLLKDKQFSVGSVLCSIGQAANDCVASKISVFLVNGEQKIQILDEGKAIAFSHKKLRELLRGSEITMSIELKNGNYTASALTTVE